MSEYDNDPLVRKYFKRFDTVAGALGAERAAELREELASHLAESLPLSPSQAQVTDALASMGDPAIIVDQEIASASNEGVPRLWTVVGPIVVIVLIVLLGLIFSPAILSLGGAISYVIFSILGLIFLASVVWVVVATRRLKRRRQSMPPR